MALPALATAAWDATARAQLAAAWPALSLYLAGWSLALLGARALWKRLEPTAPVPAPSTIPSRTVEPWQLAVPLLALAALAYWNGAILDPLQARGFPDYVTQMAGARKLLAGQLPYNPDIRVWTDVNLPPITLLLLFAPFVGLPVLAGKLTYFALNHVAFLVGLVLIGIAARPPAVRMPGTLWAALACAVAMTYEPWHDSLRLGQQNGFVLCLVALSAAALVWRRDWLAGAALAAALIGKPSAALLGVYFLLTRRWKAAAGAAIAGAGAFLLTLPWAGVENWRYYLLEKAPEILAGTPQQSNVALLALHARLFLPADALSSFDAMPPVPVAQWLTRAAQVLGLVLLWLLVRPHRAASDRPGHLLEFGITLVLSLSLVGHAWQSYTTWLIVAFIPALDPRLWQAVAPRARQPLMALAAASYAALALSDVPLYKVVGNTTAVGAVFASLPNVALLVYAFVLAALLHAHDQRYAVAGGMADTESEC